MSDRETADGSSGGDRSETDDTQFLPGTVVVDREDREPTPAVVINRPPCTCNEWVAYRDSETDREVTVAEDNPEYDSESDLVVVAFRETLEEQDPEKLPIEEPIQLAELNCRHYGFPKGRLQVVDDTTNGSPNDQLDRSVASECSSAESKFESETDSEAADRETGPNSGETRSQDSVDEGSSEKEEVVDSEKRELSPEFEALRDRLADSATVSVEWVGSTPRLHVEKLGTEYQILSDGTIEGDEALRDQFKPLVEEYLAVNE